MVATLKAQCMTCQAQRIMLNPTVKRIKNNHKQARGKCSTCGGKMSLFVPSITKVGRWGSMVMAKRMTMKRVKRH